VLPGLVGSIPSPDSGVLHLGPLPIHLYGLMLALGVLAAAAVGERRWAAMGGDPKVIGEIGVGVVAAGVVGARLYHLFTGYDWDRNGLTGTIQIWKGGLSIWGAVGGGALAVVVLTRRRNLDTLAMCDALAPGIALAQAIGRWGNYFNQELFGRPSTLPWALEIDPQHRPAGYERFATFHPSFLYESLWMLLVVGVLLLAERHLSLRRGQTFALYVALYTSFRVFEEWLRVDPATKVGGIRFNALLSAALCVIALGWLLRLRRHGRPAGPVTDFSRGAQTSGGPVA
jgi:prolipoprotein diacylglyceryl transferase